MCLLYNYLAQTLLKEWRETAGTQVEVSPKIQMLEYNQTVGPTKSEAKLTKVGCVSAGRAHAMHHFTKKEKSNNSHLLQRDKSN